MNHVMEADALPYVTGGRKRRGRVVCMCVCFTADWKNGTSGNENRTGREEEKDKKFMTHEMLLGEKKR